MLVLTALGDEADKVRGLRLGADDYVTKPFGLLELLARVDALLRRVARAPPRRARGSATSRCARRRTRCGATARRSPYVRRSTSCSMALLRREGAVATRDELLREVWRYDASVTSRTVDTHVLELRRKLEPDPACPRHLLTVRKSGYRLER